MAVDRTAANEGPGGDRGGGPRLGDVDNSDADFERIQAAHDDLPAGGGLIVVDGTYNSDTGAFPITINKQSTIHGCALTRCRVWAAEDETANLFEITEPYVNISNLYLRYGNHGIVLDGASYFNGR